MTTKPTYTPALRFPDFLNDGEWRFVHGNELFEPIVNKNHNSDLPVLAITQDQGAVPRDMIDYNVIVSDKSIAGYKVVEVGDFIISLRSFQGGIEYSNYKGLCSPAYIVLRRKNELICNDFYRHFFKSARFIQDLNRNLEGIRDGKMVSYQQFSTIRIPFPPLSEQRRIAACLSALDEMLAATNGKLEQLKAYKKGLVQNLFNQQGGVINNINKFIVGRLRFPEFKNEKEWEEKKLGELTNTFSGGTPTASNKEYYGGDIPFIRSGEINSNSTELFLTQLGLENSAAKLVEKGTILYALYGATSGEVGIAKIGGAINQAILAIIPCEKLDPLFLFFSLQNQKDSIVNQYIQGGQGNLSGSIINSLNFSFPSLPEQRKIASCLFAMDDQINAYTEKVGLLGQYKKGLMQGMFPPNQMN